MTKNQSGGFWRGSRRWTLITMIGVLIGVSTQDYTYSSTSFDKRKKGIVYRIKRFFSRKSRAAEPPPRNQAIPRQIRPTGQASGQPRNLAVAAGQVRQPPQSRLAGQGLNPRIQNSSQMPPPMANQRGRVANDRSPPGGNFQQRPIANNAARFSPAGKPPEQANRVKPRMANGNPPRGQVQQAIQLGQQSGLQQAARLAGKMGPSLNSPVIIVQNIQIVVPTKTPPPQATAAPRPVSNASAQTPARPQPSAVMGKLPDMGKLPEVALTPPFGGVAPGWKPNINAKPENNYDRVEMPLTGN